MSEPSVFGIIVRLQSAEDLVEATQVAKRAGFHDLDAFAPFPVPGLVEALGYRERLIPPLSLVMGLLAAAGAFFMQWYASFDYPYVVGGKPLNSWPAFLLITFEVGVLASVLTAMSTMLFRNGLPQPYHPVFNDPDFDDASTDGFFLLCPGASLTDVQDCLKDIDTLHIRELAS